jgi:selT/selW/selH-like putative selenoprotein
LPQATSLAAEISNRFGIDATLIQGVSGVFDVVVDGKTVFSKHKEKRFPENAEVVSAISQRQPH